MNDQRTLDEVFADDHAALARDASREIVNPATGELVSLDGPTDLLASQLADIRALEALLREVKRAFTGEVVARMDKAVETGESGSWTVRVGPWTLKAPSPAPTVEYDTQALRDALDALADLGVIGPEAVDRVCQPILTYKVNRSALTTLSKANAQVAKVVAEHSREVQKDRRVTVERTAA